MNDIMSAAIFVFTGTGNSLQIARSIADRTGAEIIMMPCPEGTDVSRYGNIGFVFPVHYYKAPLPVSETVHSLRFSTDQEVWAVMDYGTTPGDAARITFDLLKTTGAKVLFSVGYRMPENYIMMFDPPDEPECRRMCEAVPSYAEEVCRLLEAGESVEPRSGIVGRIVSAVGGPFYDRWRKTAKFRVSDECTSCGLCAEICPSKAISMENGRPSWITDSCYHCAACINRCPAEAIDYGKGSVKRRRYVNGILDGNH